ncbi:hypothetical protein, partial [Escherichia coli]|uniref:hypothetical protein n=1 Tax=Escherichia coli TaxID=562 RepID=UPI0032DB611B
TSQKSKHRSHNNFQSTIISKNRKLLKYNILPSKTLTRMPVGFQNITTLKVKNIGEKPGQKQVENESASRGLAAGRTSGRTSGPRPLVRHFSPKSGRPRTRVRARVHQNLPENFSWRSPKD